ncbi:MAG: CidA/LrgA family protein [Spirochaetes bacterium]|nr:CidA/LrgA family protein [Spirochaetota bacterium]
MRLMNQLGIILVFALAGEIFARFFPAGLPASVMGMLFLFAALGIKALKPRHIAECSDFLSGIMAFFFLPAVAAVIQNFHLVLPVLWQLVFIAVVCTFITFFASYGTVRALRVLQKHVLQKRVSEKSVSEKREK